MPYCPTRDEIYQTLLALLPPGLAYQGGDAADSERETVMHRYLYGISKPFFDIEVALCQSFDEMFVATAVADRSEWLEDYGLPDEFDPDGVSLEPRLRARASTEISNYEEIATSLGYTTSMRWLTGDDVEFPGVVSTLRIEIDATSAAFVPPIIFDGSTFDEGIFSGLTPVDLIGILDGLIPAECAITSAVV